MDQEYKPLTLEQVRKEIANRNDPAYKLSYDRQKAELAAKTQETLTTTELHANSKTLQEAIDAFKAAKKEREKHKEDRNKNRKKFDELNPAGKKATYETKREIARRLQKEAEEEEKEYKKMKEDYENVDKNIKDVLLPQTEALIIKNHDIIFNSTIRAAAIMDVIAEKLAEIQKAASELAGQSIARKELADMASPIYNPHANLEDGDDNLFAGIPSPQPQQ